MRNVNSDRVKPNKIFFVSFILTMRNVNEFIYTFTIMGTTGFILTMRNVNERLPVSRSYHLWVLY